MLRLVIGTLETTFVIPPRDGDGNAYQIDGKFDIVLYNKEESSTGTILAEYTGFLSGDLVSGIEEESPSLMVTYELATRGDAYLQIDHTETIPTVLISADTDNIKTFGNGSN